MANLIQLEAYNSKEVLENWYETWINSDHILRMMPFPKGTQIYLREPTSIQIIYVRESPQQVRDKVVAERKAKPEKGWLK